MKRFLILLALLGVLVSIIPAQASALTLQQRVSRIEAKLNCLRYAGISEWTGYQYFYDGNIELTAASFDTANGLPHSAGDFRMVVVRPTRACRARFAPVVSTYLGSTSRRPQMQRLEKIQLNY